MLLASRFHITVFKYLVTFDTDETSKDIRLRQNEKPYEKGIEEIKWARGQICDGVRACMSDERERGKELMIEDEL